MLASKSQNRGPFTRSRIRVIVVLLLLAALLLQLAFPSNWVAWAHGKELSIKVSSFTSDPNNPLVRLFRAQVEYASDLEPVTGAQVWLTADRRGGGPAVEPVPLEPLNEPGIYAGEVVFPLYGSWNVILTVKGSREGTGESGFVESVVPAGPQVDNDEVREKVLQLFFNFNWRDVAAIMVRIIHSLASMVWFGLTAVILVAHWFVSAANRPPIFARLSIIFAPAAFLSLAVLMASGIYTGIYSAPVKPPGIFDFNLMWRIPFGPAYLATIGFKVLALATCGILAVAMNRVLRSASYPMIAGGDDNTAAGMVGVAETSRTRAFSQDRALFHLAAVNAVIGIAIAAAVAVAVYLHYISHLAVFLPN